MCHSEVIKYIKELESKKHVILRQEENDCASTPIRMKKAKSCLTTTTKRRVLISDMSARQQISQRSSCSGKMEITCCNYDVEKVLKEYEELRLVIGRLQVAIDRANFTNFVEVDV